MAKVSLSRGLVAMVDEADLSLLIGHSWCANPSDSAYDALAAEHYGEFACLNRAAA